MIKKRDLLNFLYYNEKAFYEENNFIFVRETKGAATGTAFKFDEYEILVDFYTFGLK